jgi:hypothetical protein
MRRVTGTALAALAATGGLTASLWTAAAVPARALDPATVQVPAGLTTGRVLLVRPARVDVVQDGRVRRVVPIPGRLDLARLPSLVGDAAFASAPRAGVVRLDATLAQRPGSVVTGTSPGLSELRLGPGVRLHGTRASLDLDGVTVAAATPGRDTALPDATLRYTHGASLELTGVTVRAPQPAGSVGPAAVQVDEGTTLRAERVRVDGGGESALRVAEAGAVTLDDVTLESARGNGLDVSGGRSVTLTRVTARGNAGIGVALRDPGGLRLHAGLRANGNHAAGIDLLSLRDLRLTGLVTAENGGPGVQLRSSKDVTLAGLRSTADVTGLSVTGSADIHVSDLTARRSATGISVKDTGRLDAARVTVTGARDDGIALAGRTFTLADVRVEGAGEGLVVATGTHGVELRDGRFGGDRSGIRIAAGTRDVTARRLTLDAPGGVALRSGGERVLVEGVTATGGVGVDLRGSASIEHSSVRAVTQALRVAQYGRVGVRNSALTARDVGISAGDRSQVLVTGSTVDARRAADGDITFGDGNDVSRQPIRWVAIAGLLAMGLAVGLEVMRKTRERGQGATRAPGHVLNRT